MLDLILIKDIAGINLHKQIHQAAYEIRKRLESQQIIEKNVVSISCFIRAKDITDFAKKKKLIEENLRSCFINTPPINVIAESPARDKNLIIELSQLCNVHDQIIIEDKSLGNVCYKTIIDLKTNIKTLWVSGIYSFNESIDTKKGCQQVFQQAREILSLENMSFGDIYRQWNYIGEITRFQSEYSMHNYQLFNNVRADFYSGSNFNDGYPAATGIGMEIPGVVLSFWAASGNEIKCIPVNNKFQVEAYDYSEQQLLVRNEKPANEKCTPKFARAKYIRILTGDALLISGTASIIGENTVFDDDIEKQTETTLDNIHQLVSAANEQLSSLRQRPFHIKYLRAYIKNQAHVSTVADICDARYPNIPKVLVQADACRPQLLVEIEGVAG